MDGRPPFSTICDTLLAAIMPAVSRKFLNQKLFLHVYYSGLLRGRVYLSYALDIGKAGLAARVGSVVAALDFCRP